MENQKPRKKRAKKVDTTAYDNYVANVSGGMEPPTAAKRRRKKKVDTDAYDQYLAESEPQPVKSEKSESRRQRRERVGEQVKMDLKPESKQPAEDYDDYLVRDDADEKPARKAAGGKKRRKHGKKRMSAKRRRQRRRKIFSVCYIAAMLLILVGFGAVAVKQYQAHQHYLHMRQVVEDQRFYEGTTVDGYDLSGMTLEEAQAFFENSVEPQYRNRSVRLTTGEMLTAEQLGYSSNYHSVLRAAWSAGRNGTLQERYDAIMAGDIAATTHTVTRAYCTENTVTTVVATIAGYTDRA